MAIHSAPRDPRKSVKPSMIIPFPKKIRQLALFILVVFGLAWKPSHSADAIPLPQQSQPIIYFFWGDGCPHCAEAKPFLEELTRKYPSLQVRSFEVWYSEENRDELKRLGKNYGFEPTAVPTTFIGQQYWVGWNEVIAQQVEETVQTCLLNGCPDPGSYVAGQEPTPLPETNPTPPVEQKPDKIISLPLFGKIDLDQQSLFLSTLLISFVDGVNPCSIWVLTMLLALVVHTGSRRKILLIGLIFLTVTAGVYAVFIAGLFTLFSYINYIKWIQLGVSLIALVFAVINIKDYFWYKEGVSLTIAEKDKPGLVQKMRNVLAASSGSLWGLITATVALAFGVSMVEFSCTAGFPVLWTNLLTANQASPAQFGLLLLLYMVIYQIDELVIFLAAVFTLRASRLEEKQGRILKLVGGVLMMTLAVVMIINPAIMNSLTNSLIIFSAAFGLAILILVLHRRILPRFGIWIGSEAARHRKNTVKTRRRKH